MIDATKSIRNFRSIRTSKAILQNVLKLNKRIAYEFPTSNKNSQKAFYWQKTNKHHKSKQLLI